MKTIKVEWTEREVVQYHYEEEIEVDDDVEINLESISVYVEPYTFDSISTTYAAIDKFVNKETGVLEVKSLEIDSYEEIFPPSPEEKKAEYQQKLIDLQKDEDEIKIQKDEIIKLLTKL